MARKFEELKERARSDPRRAAAIDAHRQAMEAAMRLAELRGARGRTQQELASNLAVSQANVSRIERGHDLYLSTLSRYVEALGGRLEVTAVFPDQIVPLTTLEEPRREPGDLDRTGAARGR